VSRAMKTSQNFSNLAQSRDKLFRLLAVLSMASVGHGQVAAYKAVGATSGELGHIARAYIL